MTTGCVSIFYPANDLIQRVDVELFLRQAHDINYDMWETIEFLSAMVYLKGSTYMRIKAEYSTEIFIGQRFKTGGFDVLLRSQPGKKVSLTALYRHKAAIYYSADPFQGTSNFMMLASNYKPLDKIHLDLSYRYSDFSDPSANRPLYDYSILRGKITYQMNKHFFLRAISEYNSYRSELLTDFLASFTWVPGTVVYLGYGSLYERLRWEDERYIADERFMETTRGFFFKSSYLHRF